MKQLGFRLLVLWYRLLGSTPVQAEWRARQALTKPSAAQHAITARAARIADRRFTCVCGQLLVEGDRSCHQCGRRQWLPFWARRGLRWLGLERSTAMAGTLLAATLMGLGQIAQLRYAQGTEANGPGHYLGMLELGAAFGPLNYVQPWRALTYTMLHGGFWHILFNAIALFQIGPLIERRVGSARFIFGWVFAGACGVLLPTAVGYVHQSGAWITPVVGASGAITGLLGMATVRGHLDGTAAGRAIRDMCIKWMIYITIFGFLLGSVAHDAHFAGFAGGALVGWALPPVDGSPSRRRLSLPLGLTGVGAIFAALLSYGMWMAEGAPIPDDAPMKVKLPWRLVLAEVRGAKAALGGPAYALIERAVSVRGLPSQAPALRRFTHDVGLAAAAMPEDQRQIFLEWVRRELRKPPPQRHRPPDRPSATAVDELRDGAPEGEP